MKAGIAALVLVALAGFVGYFIATAGSARAAFPGLNGKIAFTSDRDGNREIYIMNPDGTEQTNLTNHPSSDSRPAWSADGTRIAFVSDRTGISELFVMNADGGDLRSLTQFGAGSPSWSPDGTKIAFVRNLDIYVLTIGLSPPANLTAGGFPPPMDMQPAWSPDGSQIAFVSNRLDRVRPSFDLYVMDTDGALETGPLALDAFTPNWSPDGSKIAFKTAPIGGPPTAGISVVAADGGTSINLTNFSGDCCPAWSPDGTEIAFESTRDSTSDIYVMNADGSGQTNLTNNPATDYGPDWQPLGAGSFPAPTATLASAPTSTPVELGVELPQTGTRPLIASGAGFGRPVLLAGMAAIVGTATLAAAWYARRRQRARV